MAYHPTLINGYPPAAKDLDWLLASRALAFGEGVFTSIRVWQGQVAFELDHHHRLRTGLAALQAQQPEDFWQQLQTEVITQARQLQEGMLKVMLLAGPGGRGYRRCPSGQTWHRVLLARPLTLLPQAYRGVTLWWQAQPVASAATQGKHLNRLSQVLASENCPADYPEALLHNEQGHLTEALAHNVFWFTKGQGYTPALSTGALEGVMRKQLLKHLAACKRPVDEKDDATLDNLLQADEILICNSLQGIWPVCGLHSAEGELGHWPLGPETAALLQAFHPAMGLPGL